MTKIVFLGVGGWISNPVLGYTSFAVFSDSGKWVLVEAGEGVYSSLRRCGLDIDNNLKAVIISHRHGDHILGLPTILQMAKHRGVNRVVVVSIDDVGKAIKSLLEASGSQNVLDVLSFVSLGYNQVMDFEGFKIEFIEAVHTVPAASIKIVVDGKCIVYSGDTIYNPKLVEFAKNCDVLIHEASGYIEEAHRYGHSTYLDAIDIAVKSGVKRLVLIHFYLWPQPIKTPIDKDLEILIPHPCQEMYL